MDMPMVIQVVKEHFKKRTFIAKIKKIETMKKRFWILLIVGICTHAQGQDIDTSLMLFKAKVCLLEYSTIHTNVEVTQYFNRELPYKILGSKGFSKKLTFFEVPIRIDSTVNYKFIYDYSFIFAYNNVSDKIYRLKGFHNNEFDLFFRDLLDVGNIDFYDSSTDDLSTVKRFVRTFEVENLDLKCLYKSMKKRKAVPDCICPARRLLD